MSLSDRKASLTLCEEQIERISRASVGEELIDALYISVPVDSIDNGAKMGYIRISQRA